MNQYKYQKRGNPIYSRTFLVTLFSLLFFFLSPSDKPPFVVPFVWAVDPTLRPVTQSQSDSASSIASISSQYVRGLRFYQKRGEEAKSYPFFEEVFASPAASLRQKLFASFVLAYASPSLLNQKKQYVSKKQDYGRFYLKNQKGLTQKVQMDIHRIIGDACFSQRLFEDAKKEYLFLSSDESSLRNQAYGQYRLGWIELNQEKPEDAFFRWKNFLVEKGSALEKEDSGLYRAISQDLGKAWVESIEVKEGAFAGQLKALPTSPEFQSHTVDFAEGIVLGMKRVGRADIIGLIRKELVPFEYGKWVFEGLLQKGFVFKHYPCLIAEWAKDFTQVNLPPREVLSLCNGCARIILEKKQCSTPEAHTFYDFFESLTFQQLDAGLDPASEQSSLLPRISFSVGCRAWGSACRDFIQMGIQAATVKGKRLDPDSFKPLSEACGNVFESQELQSKKKKGDKKGEKPLPESSFQPSEGEKSVSSEVKSQLKRQIAEFVHLWSAKKLLQKEKTDPLYPFLAFFLKDPEFKSSWTQKVLQNVTDFSEYPLLVELLLEHFSSEEKQEWGEKLLTLYSPTPLSGLWFQVIQLLVQKKMNEKRYVDLRQLLVQYVPIQPTLPQDVEKSQLWEFFWLGLPQEEKKPEPSLEPSALEISSVSTPSEKVGLDLAASQTVPSSVTLSDFESWWTDAFSEKGALEKWSAERKIRVFALAMKFSQIHRVWDHWAFFSKTVHTQTQFKVPFFQASLDLLTQNSLDSEKLKNSQEGKLLIRIREADLTLNPNEVRKVLGLSPDLLSELDTLEKLRVLAQKNQKIGLHLNAYLVSNIGMKIKNLNHQQQIVVGTPWSKTGLREEAIQVFSKTIQVFLTQIEKVRKALLKHPELAELDANLMEIMKQISDQLDQVKVQVATASSPKEENPQKREGLEGPSQSVEK